MSPEQITIETLRKWSHILLWVSIILPVIGGIAAGTRYYVERYEKQLSSKITTNAIQGVREEAITARQELTQIKADIAPRRINAVQRDTLLSELTNLKGQTIAFSCKMMDGESCNFASDLAAVFKDAGCQVPDIIKTSLNDLPGYLAVTAHGPENQNIADQLLRALTHSGINAKIETIKENSIGGWYPNITHIIVGSKGV